MALELQGRPHLFISVNFEDSAAVDLQRDYWEQTFSVRLLQKFELQAKMISFSELSQANLLELLIN
jgi:hypothetical protein